MIRAVVSDLDGTFLDKNGDLPSANVDAIKALKEMNVKFGIATGRKISAITELLQKWGISDLVDFFVGENGAEILVNDVHEQVFALSPKLMKNIIDEYTSKFNVAFGAYKGKDFICNEVNEIVTASLSNHGLNFYASDDLPNENAEFGKILLLANPKDISEILEYSKTNISDEYRSIHSGKNMIEFVLPGCSKSVGLIKALDKFGFTLSDCISFGDASNDVEMIRDCKIGCVIEHGTDEAKAVADCIIGSNSDGAVGKTIMKFIDDKTIVKID